MTFYRVTCPYRCFWSTRLPSDRVPGRRTSQTLLRTQPSRSGGLHKLLSVSAQVRGVYILVCVCVSETGMDWWMDLFSRHSKRQEKRSLVSAVADLRSASLQTTRFVAETLLLLEVLSRPSVAVCGWQLHLQFKERVLGRYNASTFCIDAKNKNHNNLISRITCKVPFQHKNKRLSRSIWFVHEWVLIVQTREDAHDLTLHTASNGLKLLHYNRLQLQGRDVEDDAPDGCKQSWIFRCTWA